MERVTILLHRDSMWSRRTSLMMMSSIRLRLGSLLTLFRALLRWYCASAPDSPPSREHTDSSRRYMSGRPYTALGAPEKGSISPASSEIASLVPRPSAISCMNSRPSSPALPSLIPPLSFRRPAPRLGGWLF